MKLALLYLVVINIVAFILYGIDKNRAKQGDWRIPEATLIAIAAIGGSIGAYAGMRAFHHKTRKPLFRIGVPVIILIQTAAFFLLRW